MAIEMDNQLPTFNKNLKLNWPKDIYIYKNAIENTEKWMIFVLCAS